MLKITSSIVVLLISMARAFAQMPGGDPPSASDLSDAHNTCARHRSVNTNAHNTTALPPYEAGYESCAQIDKAWTASGAAGQQKKNDEIAKLKALAKGLPQ